MSFVLYFFSFLLTDLGFLLGKSTVEEHNEVREYVTILVQFLKILFYLLLFYVFFEDIIIFFVFVVFSLLFIVFNYIKNYDLLIFHDILLFSMSFLFLMNHYSEKVYFLLVLMFALIFENSLKEFNKKEEIYSIVFYVLIYFGYNFIIF